jgi:hypothetical protein
MLWGVVCAADAGRTGTHASILQMLGYRLYACAVHAQCNCVPGTAVTARFDKTVLSMQLLPSQEPAPGTQLFSGFKLNILWLKQMMSNRSSGQHDVEIYGHCGVLYIAYCCGRPRYRGI